MQYLVDTYKCEVGKRPLKILNKEQNTTHFVNADETDEYIENSGFLKGQKMLRPGCSCHQEL